MKIGIIGAGHLGKALIAGLTQSGMKQEQIILNARSKETLEAQKQKYPGMEITTDKKELAAKADIIVLVVKAQNAGEVLAEIGETDLNGKTIISLMAGVTLDDMRKMLKNTGSEYRLARMMPTVGISICKGVIGVSWENGQTISEEVMDLFRPLGYLIPLPEEKAGEHHHHRSQRAGVYGRPDESLPGFLHPADRGHRNQRSNHPARI